MLLDFIRLFGDVPGLSALRYLSVRVGVSAMAGFLFTLLFIPLVIKLSNRLRFGDREGKSDSDTLEALHANKRKTPVLGGLAILAATFLTVLAFGRIANFYVLLSLGTLLSLGLCGFTDDLVKTFGRDKRSGLTPRQKLAWQAATALIAGMLLVAFQSSRDGLLPKAFAAEHEPSFHCELEIPVTATERRDFEDLLSIKGEQTIAEGTTIYPPFFKDLQIQLGFPLFLLFTLLVMVGSSNAVNLTDGLDGLAAGCTIFVALLYTLLSYVAGRADWSLYLGLPYVPGVGEVSVVCAAISGACAGFLWFNCHPAEIFMGDTGSLPLGGMLGLAAIMTKHDLLLALAGGIFVAEACSVLLQVSIFKLTKKRVLRCAPLHHHFEFGGWKETKVVQRFWIIGAFLALAALTTLKLR